MMTVLLLALMSVQNPPPASVAVPTGFLFRDLKHQEKTYRYIVYVPRNYDPQKEWPVILFLHGMGECGSDGVRQMAQGIGTAIQQNPSKWPFLVVMPQKPDMRDAWEDHDEAVMAILDTVLKEYSVDRSRQYLTGLSQGGHGTWVLGARHADRWAAIAPICGYGDPKAIAPALKSVPIWCFHGEDDKVVPVSQSQAICEAIKTEGGNPKLTTYPGVGHNSWDKAYREEALDRWFLEHRRPDSR